MLARLHLLLLLLHVALDESHHPCFCPRYASKRVIPIGLLIGSGHTWWPAHKPFPAQILPFYVPCRSDTSGRPPGLHIPSHTCVPCIKTAPVRSGKSHARPGLPLHARSPVLSNPELWQTDGWTAPDFPLQFHRPGSTALSCPAYCFRLLYIGVRPLLSVSPHLFFLPYFLFFLIFFSFPFSFETLWANRNNLNQIFPVGGGFGLLLFFEKFEDTYFRNGVIMRQKASPKGPFCCKARPDML